MSSYDVIIIGSGPGGYVCAIRCAQLGLKTAVVEGRETLGGTCLNIGCIPSKALLHASHQLHEAEHNFAKMGLKGKSPSVDWKQMLSYKDEVIGQNTKGIEFLFKKNKIDWLKGWGSIPEAGKVKVGDEIHEAKKHNHCNGFHPVRPARHRDRRKGRRHLRGRAEPAEDPPKKMVVIGAGVIGLELGSVYARLRHRGRGDRVSRPDHPRHGQRSLQDIPKASGQAGPRLHAWRGGAVGRGDQEQGQGHLQAAQG